MTADQTPPPGNTPVIGVVLKGYPRLSETFIAQELEALEARGFTLHIWSLRAPYDAHTHPVHARIKAPVRYLPEYLYQQPLRVLRGLAAAMRLPGFGRALRTWLRDLRRDPTPNRVRRFGQALALAREGDRALTLLYAHFLHTPSSVARYAALMRGLDWAASAHAKDIWTSPDWEVAEKLAGARFCVTCTGIGAERLASLAPPGRVSLVYHGLDLTALPPPPPARAPNAGADTPIGIVSVGRLVAKKGYEVLLTALTRLPADLNWRLIHIGGGALTGQLKAEAERLDLAQRIEWRGKAAREDVFAALAGADLFILPSRIASDGDRDGLPNVLMEAASQKLAILSTSVSAIPEFIRHGREGILVAPGDAAALGAGITRLARDPALRMRLGEAAYERLHAEFAMTDCIGALQRRLTEALEDGAS